MFSFGSMPLATKVATVSKILSLNFSGLWLTVIAYDLGGPGELIQDGFNGFLVRPNDIDGLIKATKSLCEIKRENCRMWVEKKASNKVFAKRVESWILKGLNNNFISDLQD